MAIVTVAMQAMKRTVQKSKEIALHYNFHVQMESASRIGGPVMETMIVAIGATRLTVVRHSLLITQKMPIFENLLVEKI